MSGPVEQVLQADQRLAELRPVPFHLPVGKLAPAVAGAYGGMDDGDWILAGLRERVGAVLRGVAVDDLRDLRVGHPSARLAPVSDAPGSRALHAVGLAMSSGRPVLCFLGLASAASGHLHEALNAAALTRSAVIFLLFRQRIDEDAPVGPQLAFETIELAGAFDIGFNEVAGTIDAVRDAVAAARDAGNPTIIQVLL